MLKLLTLVSALGLATAETCEDFDCTAAIAGGVQAGNVQTVSTHVLFDRKRAVHDPYFLFFFYQHVLVSKDNLHGLPASTIALVMIIPTLSINVFDNSLLQLLF